MKDFINEERSCDIDATEVIPFSSPETADVIQDDEDSLDSLLKLISHMKDTVPESDDDEDVDDSGLDADDYHNKAVNYARRDRNHEAAEICIRGLKKFPNNVDLLADTVKYSSESGDMVTAATYYSMLKERVPVLQWNWRAFTFSFDYLLKNDPVANESECRSIVSNYKKYLPFEERASVAESELEEALGNTESSMEVLKKAIRTHTNASQCALRLADMQKDRGLYEDVLMTTNYGIAASAEPQPSINIPYLYFLRTLAKDHLLHRKECSGEPITNEELKALMEEYDLLISEFPELTPYVRTLTLRKKMLKFVKAE